jgi:homoserine kinase type II
MDLTHIWDIPEPRALRKPTWGINNLTQFVDTDSGSYVLRVYKQGADPARVGFEVEVMRQLAAQNLSFAVPSPLPTRSGELIARVPGPGAPGETPGGPAEALATLVPVIPGDHPEWGNRTHAFARGRALGELTRALARVNVPPPPGMTTYGDLAHHRPSVPDPVAAARRSPVPSGRQEALARFIEQVMAEVPSVYAALPRQIIHGDYVTVNILMAEGRVSGVLDFEIACHDLRALDLASALPIPLGAGEPTDWDLIDAVGRGYTNQQELTSAEAEALPALLRIRRATIFVHMAGHFWEGTGREDLLHYGADTALQAHAWLEAHGAELVRRSRSWTR